MTPPPEYPVSFGGLLLMIGDFSRYLLKQWKLLFFFLLIGGLLGFLLASRSVPTYSAKLTFMVNEHEGGGSNVDNLLGTLGLDRSGGSQYNLPKILELSRSMYIIRKVLLSKIALNGQEDFFGNHFIRQYHLHQSWQQKDLNDFWFQHPDFSTFNATEKKALKLLYALIVGTETTDGAYSNSLSSDSQIMTLSINTPSEDLSVEVLLAIYSKLSTYYVQKTTEKQQATFESIVAETDSIQQKLKTAEYQLAQFQDTRQDLVRQRAQLERNRLLRQVTLYSTIYAESIKNLELSKFNLKQKTPFIQAIDLPFRPLLPVQASLVKYILLGISASLFLGISLLIAYKIVIDALAREQQNQLS